MYGKLNILARDWALNLSLAFFAVVGMTIPVAAQTAVPAAAAPAAEAAPAAPAAEVKMDVPAAAPAAAKAAVESTDNPYGIG
ncbi:MAG: hypothetical protein WBC08_09725, partial [Rhodoferax sp.]